MKNLAKACVLGATATLMGLSGMTQAQNGSVANVTSLGEQSEVLACFYECKEGYLPDWWQEVTTLMVMNPGPETTTPLYFILDGNENFIAISQSTLSPFDIDEINICRSLEASAGVPTPSAGMILVATDVGEDPLTQQPYSPYVFIKNLGGKFFKDVDEPFDGRVSSLAKTECRVVPPTVSTYADVIDAVGDQDPRPNLIQPVLIEDTGED